MREAPCRASRRVDRLTESAQWTHSRRRDLDQVHNVAGTRWFACRSTAGALDYQHEGVGGPGAGAVGSMTGTPGLAVAATGAQVTASYAGTNHSIYTRLLTRIAVDPSRRSATGTTMEGVAAANPPQ